MGDLLERDLRVAGWRLPMLIPRDSEALLDERAFAEDEFMPYWAELWPSGRALAEAVAQARPHGRVLELGCGLGLPSLAAALGGAHVLATDWAQEAVALLALNAARCGAELATRCWAWDEDPATLDGPFALVLAADVLYEERNAVPVLRALEALVAPDGEAWIADPGRRHAAAFLAAAGRSFTVRAEPRVGATLYRLAHSEG